MYVMDKEIMYMYKCSQHIHLGKESRVWVREKEKRVWMSKSASLINLLAMDMPHSVH